MKAGCFILLSIKSVCDLSCASVSVPCPHECSIAYSYYGQVPPLWTIVPEAYFFISSTFEACSRISMFVIGLIDRWPIFFTGSHLI